ncbi:Gfo/Idh/MocA family protein [Roseibium salinum]|uniref:Gfo/Idh/MocA family oxidoreductase n=1 Tax=Roseibium salinum TaxID=1604349 RepID=A0ABT3R8J7_9HYPH|nr:Gfo/Idh/MocA family oxidoreductase [Roseibium sp. DSM 29163]MCX2725625.1 Gfo/Idh/MocA family oxidoreductase [Roseibium sp. DSM 29163]
MHTAVMVGCGAMSEGWLRALQDINAGGKRVEIVGFVDLDGELAQRRAQGSGFVNAAAGSDLADQLTRLKPDLVFDIVVPAARNDVVARAFQAGCDVLSEKPMANSLADAKALLESRRQSGRLHAVIQNRRFLKGIRRARNFLKSGAIGTVAEVHCDFFIAPHFGGFREDMAHVLLHDMAIHTFDAARYVADLEPTRVFCHESNPVHSWYRHGASAVAIFECENDVTMTYRGSWCAEGAPTSWEASWRIVGSRGTLLWDGNEGFRAEIVKTKEGFLFPLESIEVPDLAEPFGGDGHAGVIADFLDARERGSVPLTDSADNIRSLAMTFAAIQSAEDNQVVEIFI